MYGGQCTLGYTSSMLCLQKYCLQKGIEFDYGFLGNESLIPRGRNIITSAFLKTKATHMMCIDADIQFPVSGVQKLLDMDKDICGGVYPMKTLPIKYFAKYIDKETQEVEYLPTGFMLIKRKVFEGLIGKVQTYKNNNMPGMIGEVQHEFFGIGIKDNVYESEDQYFCRIAREQGFRVFVEPTIRLIHHGQFAFG